MRQFQGNRKFDKNLDLWNHIKRKWQFFQSIKNSLNAISYDSMQNYRFVVQKATNLASLPLHQSLINHLWYTFNKA